jgi:hypothetical protein
MAKKAEAKTGKRTGTIRDIVLAGLAKNPNAEVSVIFAALVKGGKGESKFNKNHLAWYKNQIRKGNLKLPNGKTLPPSTRKKVEKPAKKSKKVAPPKDKDEDENTGSDE